MGVEIGMITVSQAVKKEHGLQALIDKRRKSAWMDLTSAVLQQIKADTLFFHFDTATWIYRLHNGSIHRQRS